MSKWETLATDAQIEKTTAALNQNGIQTVVVASVEEAKKAVLSMIPEKSEVMTMTSVTLDTTGIAHEINDSGKFITVRDELSKLDREKDGLLMQKLGAAPEWVVGSVHAITEDGKVMIASNTGSQLAAYVYGSSHVVWVVGTQKIVKDLKEGEDRLTNHIVPLESERAREAYGLPATWETNVSKLLIVSREINPSRITVVFVKEALGF